MPINWTTNWPTEPGAYWLYGCPFEKAGGGSEPKMFLVNAFKTNSGVALVTSHGIIYKAEAGKCYWTPCKMPEPPKDF